VPQQQPHESPTHPLPDSLLRQGSTGRKYCNLPKWQTQCGRRRAW
jgi:hypothetical protein